MNVYRVLPVDLSMLRRLAFATNPKPKKKKKTVTKKKEPRIYCGPKAKPEGSTATVPRETVLLVRRLRAWSGWNPKDIAEVTGLTVGYISQVLQWSMRADIDPGRPPAPFSQPWIEWNAQLVALHEQGPKETTE